MSLKLHDTLSGQEQTLTPCDGETYRFYCCGPTVYGPAHIGNFRTFLIQDVLRRTLEAQGFRTRHVRNITDVDDKTIRQSRQEGVSLSDFTSKWTALFHKDCEALNMLVPHEEPSAVGHIKEQVEFIEGLIAKGHAYDRDGSVYFRVDSFEPYGRLSRLKEREITTPTSCSCSCAEVNDSDEYERDSAADFVLWKARKEEDGDNFWASPWGEGRPGWHLECSVMCKHHLGDTFDLHSGGADLIFPHHENEIAQSEAANGQPFAHHWFHITHLLVDNRKMSKSLGNLYTLADVQERGYTSAELRYVLISGHYRQPLNFNWDSFNAARSALEKLARFDTELSGLHPEARWTPGAEGNGAFAPAWEALCNDLNVPAALGALFTAVKSVENAMRSGEKPPLETFHGWRRMLHALGLVLPAQGASQEAPAEVVELAQQRWDAKKARDFAAADSLRGRIQEMGWEVKDAKEGFTLEALK